MSEYTHTLQDNVLGDIIWNSPRRYTFVYPEDSGKMAIAFDHVTKFEAMKTGCYVLHADRTTYVIPKGYLYVKIEPMELVS